MTAGTAKDGQAEGLMLTSSSEESAGRLDTVGRCSWFEQRLQMSRYRRRTLEVRVAEISSQFPACSHARRCRLFEFPLIEI